MPGRDWFKNTQGLSIPWGTNCSGHRLERPSNVDDGRGIAVPQSTEPTA